MTREEDAFFHICRVLPETIKNVVDNDYELKTPNDIVIDEINNLIYLRRRLEAVGDNSLD